MKVLHITPSSNGFEEVILLANRMNRTNHMAVIEKNGERFFTGGYILNNTPTIKKLLNTIPKEDQYKFVHEFRQEPFAKLYFEEEVVDVVVENFQEKRSIGGIMKGWLKNI